MFEWERYSGSLLLFKLKRHNGNKALITPLSFSTASSEVIR